MACRYSCMVALVFVVGMVYYTNALSDSDFMREYKSNMAPDLRDRYEKIVAERRALFYQGYCLGFVLSLLVLFLNKYYLGRRMGSVSLVCTILSVSFLTNYFYYILSPKSDWMLNHIDDAQQARAWLYVYRKHQVAYHGGLALGLVAMGFFAFAFRCGV